MSMYIFYISMEREATSIFYRVTFLKLTRVMCVCTKREMGWAKNKKRVGKEK